MTSSHDPSPTQFATFGQVHLTSVERRETSPSSQITDFNNNNLKQSVENLQRHSGDLQKEQHQKSKYKRKLQKLRLLGVSEESLT